MSALAIIVVLNSRFVPISQRKHLYPCLAAAGAAAIGLLGMLSRSHAEDPDRLWQIVHDECVPNQEQHSDPAPCALVDLKEGVERGHVILKDAFGDTQYLLIPTARVTGIESPDLLLPNAPNYFADAWRTRSYVEKAVRQTLPRAAIGLAINSVLSRSQNQLHVHIDCIRVDVQAALQRDLSAIGNIACTAHAGPTRPLFLGRPTRGWRRVGRFQQVVGAGAAACGRRLPMNTRGRLRAPRKRRRGSSRIEIHGKRGVGPIDVGQKKGGPVGAAKSPRDRSRGAGPDLRAAICARKRNFG